MVGSRNGTPCDPFTITCLPFPPHEGVSLARHSPVRPKRAAMRTSVGWLGEDEAVPSMITPVTSHGQQLHCYMSNTHAWPWVS